MIGANSKAKSMSIAVLVGSHPWHQYWLFLKGFQSVDGRNAKDCGEVL